MIMRAQLRAPAGKNGGTQVLAAAVLTVGMMLAGGSSALAQDVKVFDTPPSADELRDAFGVTKKPIGQMRSIQIDGPQTPATPPAPTPSPHTAQADEPATPAAHHQHTRPHPSAPAAATETTGKPVAMRIQFDLGSAALRPGADAFIQSIAKVLGDDKKYSLTIEGHTDASGELAKNLALSMARANAVRDVLVQKFGIDAARLKTVGKGPSEPLDPGHPFDAKNRRVQFQLGS